MLCLSFYAAVFPFIQYAPDLLVNKFGFSYELARGEGAVVLFGSLALGNASVIVAFFFFGLAFSLVPANIKNRGGKIISVIAHAGTVWSFSYHALGRYTKRTG